MKSYQCLFILSVSLCVTSFKIFPIANRRLSVSWNVDPSEEPTSIQTTIETSTETNIITTPAEANEFTNSAETLLIISEVTAPEEIDETTETIRTTAEGVNPEKSKEEKKIDLEVTATDLSTKTEEQTTEVALKVSEDSTGTTQVVTEKLETIKTPPTVPITSLKTDITTSKVPTTPVTESITSTTTAEVSTLPQLLEATPLQPLSVDLLPPKTEYRKYDFDPRYDDWNNVPLEFDAI